MGPGPRSGEDTLSRDPRRISLLAARKAAARRPHATGTRRGRGTFPKYRSVGCRSATPPKRAKKKPRRAESNTDSAATGHQYEARGTHRVGSEKTTERLVRAASSVPQSVGTRPLIRLHKRRYSVDAHRAGGETSFDESVRCGAPLERFARNLENGTPLRITSRPFLLEFQPRNPDLRESPRRSSLPGNFLSERQLGFTKF